MLRAAATADALADATLAATHQGRVLHIRIELDMARGIRQERASV